ncbi:MAG TPA: hypothetical protein VF487_21005 [Chitinophagaceae bacterium]
MFRAYGYILVAIALTGWIIYQLAIKKKKVGQLKNEIAFILIFTGLWVAIYYWAMG